jgi:hypothetical protein
MLFRRILFAVLLVTALLSGCMDNGSTGDGQGSTDLPTSATSVTPKATPSGSRATSDPNLGTSSSSPGSSKSSSKSGRLCDTKVESSNPVLRSVRFGRHDTFDRLAFDFCKPAETTLTTTVVEELIQDGSGDRVTLKGRYFIAIRLAPADAHDNYGRATVSNRAVTVAGRNMQQYKLIGDFEGVVTYGVGVKRLEETASAVQPDPNDPRHIVMYVDLGPQSG